VDDRVAPGSSSPGGLSGSSSPGGLSGSPSLAAGSEAPPTHAPPAHDPAGEVAADGGEAVSLGRRLRRPETLLSILVPLLILVLGARLVAGIEFGRLVDAVLAANGFLLAAALFVYYLGFPLRGYRWTLLLRGAGSPVATVDATEIIFLSWLVNCLVPAKLGDLYRAYLLKLNGPVSLSRTFGTVFIERVLDLFAITVLLLGAGLVSFRRGLPGPVELIFAVGLGVVVALGLGLVTLRNFGRRVWSALPLPARIHDLYDRFEEGVFSAVGRRALLPLAVTTGLIWATEGGRLYLVVAALGLSAVHLGISGAVFVALAGSLLTAVPFTPAGVGIVEAGLFGLLTIVYGVPATEAATIALVDRGISVLSVVMTGSVAYVLSPKRRGAGLRRPIPEIG
jgi:uncharacterized protein (TIRG00374 family)